MNITQKADDKSLDFRTTTTKKEKTNCFYIGFFFFLASNIKVYAYLDSNMRYIRKDMT